MSQPIAISLFAGAGGLDLGTKRAGFNIAVANEHDSDAADSLEKNFGETMKSDVDRRSILDVSTRDLLRSAGLRGRSRPALLVGGPPCTPFSKSGYWLDWKRSGKDPNASLLQEYTRVLKEARPHAFILENVQALTFNNVASRPSFERLLREIDEAGYESRAGVLNAADFGVPQARRRLFIVGVPKGKKMPELPEPTHLKSDRAVTIDCLTKPAHVTTSDALGRLKTKPEPEEIIKGQYGHLLNDIPPGDNYLFYTEHRNHPNPEFRWRSRYWSFLLKLDPNQPAPTIQAQPGSNIGPFHWENRRLRVPEIKRLFTFPDDYEFVGSRNSIQSQLGNSVPPLLAQRVAEQVLDAIS